MVKDQEFIEIGSGVLILVCIHYVKEQYSQMVHLYEQNRHMIDQLKGDSAYIHHHITHWIAMCYYNQQNIEQARLYFKECLKNKNAEFNLTKKTISQLSQC